MPAPLSNLVLLLLALWCLTAVGAGVAGPVGAVGPAGTLGPAGPVGVDAGSSQRSKPAGATPRPIASASAAAPAARANASGGAASQTGNRIEVTGNTASGTARCNPNGTASVNSIDVAGARLEGKTVIVQGRNANHVQAHHDCPGTRPQPPGAGQTNSIRIR